MSSNAAARRPRRAIPHAREFLADSLTPLAVYRLKSALARLHYESQQAAALLDWHPRVGVREGIRRVTAPA